MTIHTEQIKLDRFLKWAGVAASGGQAKLFLAHEQVTVNGVVEKRRGRQLSEGDVVTVRGQGTFRLVVSKP